MKTKLIFIALMLTTVISNAQNDTMRTDSPNIGISAGGSPKDKIEIRHSNPMPPQYTARLICNGIQVNDSRIAEPGDVVMHLCYLD